MKNFLKQLFCFHPRLKCKEIITTGYPEIRIRYESPWDLFALKETYYKCSKCGKKFWYPAGDMTEQRTEEYIYNLQMSVSKKLRDKGEYDRAIEILKL